jgi:hypothetical protein
VDSRDLSTDRQDVAAVITIYCFPIPYSLVPNNTNVKKHTPIHPPPSNLLRNL